MVRLVVDEHRETKHFEEFLDLDDLGKEIRTNSPDIDFEKEDPDYPYEKAWVFIQKLMDKLPNIYKHDVEWLEVEVATNGDEFLFKYEAWCEHIADLFDKYVFKGEESHTGYYDPEEDKRDDCVDELTGWYYLDFCD